MRWLAKMLGFHAEETPDVVREELTRTDPEFRRIRELQHRMENALAAERMWTQVALKRERQFWERQQEGRRGGT